MRVELAQPNFRGADQERTVAAFARSSTDGLIVTSGPWPRFIASSIVAAAAARHKPAVYVSRFMAASGGLISYGPDFVRADSFCGAKFQSQPYRQFECRSLRQSHNREFLSRGCDVVKIAPSCAAFAAKLCTAVSGGHLRGTSLLAIFLSTCGLRGFGTDSYVTENM